MNQKNPSDPWIDCATLHLTFECCSTLFDYIACHHAEICAQKKLFSWKRLARGAHFPQGSQCKRTQHKGELTTVHQFYESLVLYISEVFWALRWSSLPFSTIRKPETGSNVRSCQITLLNRERRELRVFTNMMRIAQWVSGNKPQTTKNRGETRWIWIPPNLCPGKKMHM